jgi:hypothetical protein
MMLFTNLVTSLLWYLGSDSMSRLAILPFLGMISSSRQSGNVPSLNTGIFRTNFSDRFPAWYVSEGNTDYFYPIFGSKADFPSEPTPSRTTDPPAPLELLHPRTLQYALNRTVRSR